MSETARKTECAPEPQKRGRLRRSQPEGKQAQTRKDGATGAEPGLGQRRQHIPAEQKQPKAPCPTGDTEHSKSTCPWSPGRLANCEN